MFPVDSTGNQLFQGRWLVGSLGNTKSRKTPERASILILNTVSLSSVAYFFPVNAVFFKLESKFDSENWSDTACPSSATLEKVARMVLHQFLGITRGPALGFAQSTRESRRKGPRSSIAGLFELDIRLGSGD